VRLSRLFSKLRGMRSRCIFIFAKKETPVPFISPVGAPQLAAWIPLFDRRPPTAGAR